MNLYARFVPYADVMSIWDVDYGQDMFDTAKEIWDACQLDKRGTKTQFPFWVQPTVDGKPLRVLRIEASCGTPISVGTAVVHVLGACDHITLFWHNGNQSKIDTSTVGSRKRKRRR